MSKEPRKSAWGSPFGPVIYQSTISDELHKLMLDEALDLQKKKENDYRYNNNETTIPTDKCEYYCD